MSRIGKSIIQIPSGVTIKVEANKVVVTGPKGELSTDLPKGISVEVTEHISVKRANDEKELRSKHGLIRSLIANTVIGVTDGFKKVLEINGVGFKAKVNGQEVTLNLGFSHPVNYKLPEGVQAQVQGNKLTIEGIDKQQVGQVAAEIRALRKPEPYKGKGIKYEGEYIIRKAGKAAQAAG